MGGEFNRRDFMGTAGVTAAGFAVASGYSPLTYGQNSKIRVGCIGVGGQGSFHIREGLAKNDVFQITAISDVYSPNQQMALKLAQLSNAKVYLAEGGKLTEEQRAAARAQPAPPVYYDYREMFEKAGVDAVVVSTPPGTHAKIVMDALDAGKFVFCESSMVISVEEGRAIIQKCHDLNRWVQVGHQRRHNPKYNLAVKMARGQGDIGRITRISAQWHRNQQWRRPLPKDRAGGPHQLNDEEKKHITDLERHLNWHLYDEISGGLYTRLMTHQADIANWFLGTLPSRVYAEGGLDYWRDGRAVDDNLVAVFKYDLKPGVPGFRAIKPRTALMDKTSANRPYSVRFVNSILLDNHKLGCSEVVYGDEGTLELTESACRWYLEEEAAVENKRKALGKWEQSMKKRGMQNTVEWIGLQTWATADPWGLEFSKTGLDVLIACNELKTPDTYQFGAFADCIQNGGVPRSNQMVGYTAALTAIAARMSRDSGGPVDIDPAWHTFDFEVPSFHDYDDSWRGEEYKPPS